MLRVEQRGQFLAKNFDLLFREHSYACQVTVLAVESQLLVAEPEVGPLAWRLWQLIVEDPANPPDMPAAADALHCSTRTLRRRLQAQGWQYQQLIDQVREIHARRALSDPTLSVTQIAHKLGYSDHSGFLRAFKKWTGLTPREFRSQLFG